ncbi:UDP-N-acetylmuramate dehydrogenase [Thermosynechococcus sp. PP22]|uniref:UDP-N-acetylmuramate dehydrogenase n=1 Tax=Thermosynechococcus sp. PP22 TaxID=3074082 RepID=UPI0028737844|nr:UDP-N-acetylmuramate dehydrogenase [Thermosynechococcus sp. PP22]WNC22915.1 UDP-N-acetylmuramate dehydrogenase [Thermosynechococcus sp. PP22]
MTLSCLPQTQCPLQRHISLAEFTTLNVGGCAEWFVEPRTVAELQAAYIWAQEQELPITVLGAGSNLLVSDRGVAGLVIATKHLRYLKSDLETGQLTVGAGYPLPKLAHYAAKLGWRGLEWIVGIPGTVGGAVVMNAGAHGGCTAERLVSAVILEPDGTLAVVAARELGYGYRTSCLQNSQRLVLQATWQLEPGHDPAQVKADTQKHLSDRLRTQPYDFPNCGSVFRNPQERTAGWLIEQTGLKGYQIGRAQVSQKHANFILNCGGATAMDVYRLIRHVQAAVADRWSVWLQPEVKLIGDFA